MDQLQHLSCEEPSLTRLVAQGYDGLGIFCQALDVGGRVKVLALCKLFRRRFAEHLQDFDAQVAEAGCGFFHAQLFRLEIAVVKAVEQEVCQVRNDGFGAFRFQQVHQIVVGGREEFYENFSDDAHLRLLFICDGQPVKVPDDFPAQVFKLAVARIFT